MNRRQLIKTLLLTPLLSFVTPLRTNGSILHSKRTRGLTIAQIMQTSFPDVRKVMLGGKMFASPALQAAYESGRIIVAPLGINVQGHPVQEIRTPIGWAKNDDTNNPLEAQKISLCTAMWENGFESHDLSLMEQLKKGDLVVSREYRYDASHVMQMADRPWEFMYIYTAFAVIPRK